MRHGILAAALAVTVADAAPKGPPPTDFKGHVLGAPAAVEKLTEDWLLRCKDQFSGKRLCSGYASVGSAPGELTVTIGVDGSLEEVDAFFPSNKYSEVRTAAVAKYGKPSVENRDPIRTKAGATFPSEWLSWKRRDGAYVSLTMHVGDINTSLLIVRSRAADDEANAQAKAQKEFQKSDL